MVTANMSLSQAPPGYWIFTHGGVSTLLEYNGVEEVRQKMKDEVVKEQAERGSSLGSWWEYIMNKSNNPAWFF